MAEIQEKALAKRNKQERREDRSRSNLTAGNQGPRLAIVRKRHAPPPLVIKRRG